MSEAVRYFPEHVPAPEPVAIEQRTPTREQLVTWRTMLIAHAQITRRLEAELAAEHDLPLASYDVLLQLAEAEGRALRMIELADRVLLSRSGLSRLVDRLVREGLVERAPCLEDARGTLAVLTSAGLNRLREASATHLRGVHDHVTSRLEEYELAELARLMTKLTPPATRSPRTSASEHRT
jgi:DNA-binding MarR family transcriptional regulator